jgi:hypothetical protein
VASGLGVITVLVPGVAAGRRKIAPPPEGREESWARIPGDASSYDFERPGHLVVSLLAEPAVLEEGLAHIAARLHAG